MYIVYHKNQSESIKLWDGNAHSTKRYSLYGIGIEILSLFLNMQNKLYQRQVYYNKKSISKNRGHTY
ncbi:MAG: hypothetical protein DRN08_02455 [Thermoplasmata archaeon]|nr:MAG: hypothetical protein DRN08_02455 [Thermoplasmata archaeon]